MTDRQKAYLFLLGAVVFFHAMTTLSCLGALGYLDRLVPAAPPSAPATLPPAPESSICIDDLELVVALARLFVRVLFPFW